MEDMQFLGYLITGLGVIFAFITSVAKVGDKIAKPMSELRLAIQKLNDTIDSVKANHENQNKRIEKHGDQIDKLDNRVGKLEVKMSMYHGDEK